MTPDHPPIPEHLPGEPEPRRWTPLSILARLGRHLLVFLVLWALSLPLWLPYLLARPWMGRAPHVPRVGRWFHHLRGLLFEKPPPPRLPLRARLALLFLLMQHAALVPVFGLAWYLDRWLYGRQLDAVRLEAPLFELSAARSGSTQLAHYLDEDPSLIAPNVLQTFFPYLWLWRLVPWTLGRLLSKEAVRARFLAGVPPMYLERHEMDPFHTDTFEIMFLGLHLFMVTVGLGPDTIRQMASATAASRWTREIWEEDLPDFIDGLGRKLLLQRPGARLMIKGHFLGSATALQRRYPDARFLTMIRDPEKRIQSVINFHRCNPTEALLGPLPWAWLVAYDLPEEVAYCEAEQRWYQDRLNCCVVRFEEYRRDLDGTLRRVYRECLGVEAPTHPLVTDHVSRKRTGYSVDRSLPQLQIDPEWLRERLRSYRNWCEG